MDVNPEDGGGFRSVSFRRARRHVCLTKIRKAEAKIAEYRRHVATQAEWPSIQKMFFGAAEALTRLSRAGPDRDPRRWRGG